MWLLGHHATRTPECRKAHWLYWLLFLCLAGAFVGAWADTGAGSVAAGDPVARPDTPVTSGTATRLMGGAIQGKAVNIGGVVTALAGSIGETGSADGPGAAARFSFSASVTTDGTNLYVADTGTIEGEGNNTIRKVAIATGVVTTLAGRAEKIGYANGVGAAARFEGPMGITTDGTNLYVAETDNNAIRKIVIATRAVTTLAGSTTGRAGSVDARGTAARFAGPMGITTDGTNLYVADTSNYTIRKIVIATGVVTTLAGNAGTSGHADGTGTAATFYQAFGITTDGANLYVADASSATIRKIVIATGVVTTLAGSAGIRGHADGTGAAASFHFPTGITTDGTNLYVADNLNHLIRKIAIASGEVTTLTLADGARSFTGPHGITTDGTRLFVCGSYNIVAVQ